MACVGGGIDVDWLVLAAACCVRGLVSGGGRGGGGVGVALLVVKRYPEPHGQVTAYNRSPVH